MSNLTMLQKQHKEVLEMIHKINILVKKDNLDTNAKEIAHNLNTLAGKFKMHLLSEDKFLYPNLMAHENEIIRSTAKAFDDEMKDVADQFAAFVKQYNVPSKILQNTNSFKTDCEKVLSIAVQRISKEDNTFYPLLEKFQ